MQMGDGIWLRDAYYGERAETFDARLGHQPEAERPSSCPARSACGRSLTTISKW